MSHMKETELLRRLEPVLTSFLADVAFLGPRCPLWCREVARQLEPILKDMKGET